MRDRNVSPAVRSLVSEIDRVTGLADWLANIVVANAYRRINQEPARAAGGHRFHRPGKTIVVRDNHPRLPVTAAIRHIDCSIPRHLDVSVNPGALGGVVDRNTGAESHTAV